MVGNEEKINGKEEKSWINLFSKYYGGTHQDTSSTGTNIDTHLLSSEFSFLRSGNYRWHDGGLLNRALFGYYWSIKAYSNPNAYDLYFRPTWLAYHDGYPKGYGFPLRCVAKLLAKLLILYVQKDGEW